MSLRVLIVDDNVDLAASLSDFLEEFGYDIDFAYSGQAGVALVAEHEYDVIVLDVSMPGMDGLQTCQRIRQLLHNPVPIIFLTARDTLSDKVAGFDAGGDDYLIKPFAPEELHCRLKALVARGKRTNVGQQTLGSLVIDHFSRTVTREGQPVLLNDNQFSILQLLASHAPQAVSRESLERAMWEQGTPDSEPLRTHIYRLRAALDKPFATPMLETVYGKGYRLVTDKEF